MHPLERVRKLEKTIEIPNFSKKKLFWHFLHISLNKCTLLAQKIMKKKCRAAESGISVFIRFKFRPLHDVSWLFFYINRISMVRQVCYICKKNFGTYICTRLYIHSNLIYANNNNNNNNNNNKRKRFHYSAST